MAQEKTSMVFISGNSIQEVKAIMHRMRAEHRKGNPRSPMAPYVLHAEVLRDPKLLAAYRVEYIHRLRLKRSSLVQFNELLLCGNEIGPGMPAEIGRALQKKLPILTEKEEMKCLLQEFLSSRRLLEVTLQALAA